MGVKLAVQTVFTALNHMSGPMGVMSRGVTQFSNHAQRAGNMARAGFGGLRTMIGAVAGVLATGAAAKAISNFAARGDDISDVAHRIGLSAGALQEFQYAAKAADMTSEDLTGVLQKMNNNMGQLKSGTGSLYTNLKATNPQLALQLKHTTDSESAFTALMDAIKGETDVSKRAALAQAAFGKSGQALIDMAGDLNQKRQEARDSGTIISQEDVDAAQNLHNSLIRIKATGMGVLNTVLAGVAKAILPIVEGLNSWIKANKGFLEQNIGTVFKVIGTVFQQLGPSIVRIIQALLPAIQQLIDRALPVLVDVLEMLLPILPLLDLLGPILDIFIALAPAIKAIAELIAAVLIPVLAILKPILELIAKLIKPIVDAISFVAKGAGGLLGGALSRIAGTPVSPNTGMISSNTTTTRNVSLDVGFGNAPPGTSIRQRGTAPEINVNMGPTLAAGGAH